MKKGFGQPLFATNTLLKHYFGHTKRCLLGLPISVLFKRYLFNVIFFNGLRLYLLRVYYE